VLAPSLKASSRLSRRRAHEWFVGQEFVGACAKQFGSDVMMAKIREGDVVIGQPVKIFFSYASEDDDIRDTLSKAMDRLSTLCGGAISTEYDKKSLEAGSPLPLISDISSKLAESDYLIIIYTGTVKKAFSWTGTELGIFWTLMNSKSRTIGGTTRKIIAIYFDEKPPVDWSALGLDLSISSSDLQISAEAFKEKLNNDLAKTEKYAQLISTFEMVATNAARRLGPAITKNINFDIEKVKVEIKTNIIPEIFVSLHKIFGRRTKKTNIEQFLIEVTIPSEFIPRDDRQSLPDHTSLLQRNGAFSIFLKGFASESTSWGELKANLGDPNDPDRAAITAAVERAIISAVSPDIPRDDEQLIRSPSTGSIYRIIVTKRFELYDGNTLVNMYFIPAMRFVFLEESNIAVTLAFINVAIKYREVFLNTKSELSILDYYREMTPSQLRSKVRRSVRELLMIEDETRVLMLNEREKIAIYYGESELDAKEIGEISKKFHLVRGELIEAEQLLLAADDNLLSGGSELRGRWEDALRNFVNVSNEVNSKILVRAIHNLTIYLKLERNAAAVGPERPPTTKKKSH
jgi:hypothetical protein